MCGHILHINNSLGMVVKIGYDCVKVIRDFVKNASPKRIKTFIAAQIECIVNPRNMYFVCISILFLYIVRQELQEKADDPCKRSEYACKEIDTSLGHTDLKTFSYEPRILKSSQKPIVVSHPDSDDYDDNTGASSKKKVEQCILIDRSSRNVRWSERIKLQIFDDTIHFSQPGGTVDTLELVVSDVQACVEAQSCEKQEQTREQRYDANLSNFCRLPVIETIKTPADKVGFARVIPDFDTSELLGSCDPITNSSSVLKRANRLSTEIIDRADAFADRRSLEKYADFKGVST